MKLFAKLVCLTLAFALCMAIPVGAQTIAPYSSSYIGSYGTSLSETSSTSFRVNFSVTALRKMDELGVDYIDIERSSNGSNWSVVKTYDCDDYSNLIDTNTIYHSGYVTYYNRQSGYQYRAYVHFYAKDGSGSGALGTYAYF